MIHFGLTCMCILPLIIITNRLSNNTTREVARPPKTDEQSQSQPATRREHSNTMHLILKACLAVLAVISVTASPPLNQRPYASISYYGKRPAQVAVSEKSGEEPIVVYSAEGESASSSKVISGGNLV